MQEIPQHEFEEIMERYPQFEPSYETYSHKKVQPIYNVCMAIQHGSKYYLWYTYHITQKVCYLIHINREGKIFKMICVDNNVTDVDLCLDTIFYGSISNETPNIFLIEDCYYYCGISLTKNNWNERWDFIYDYLSKYNKVGNLNIALPMMWVNTEKDVFECTSMIPAEYNEKIGYNIHHIQYRSFHEIVPYLNVEKTRKANLAQMIKTTKPKPSSLCFDTNIKHRFDYNQPQYRYPTVFQVTADIQYDIYRLFAFGHNSSSVYYDVAGIPDYKTSILMNSLFRNIKENTNLDYIEESDDEDDFQNMSEDKYVDLNKVLLMECVFHHKFKKWVPLRVVDSNTRIVNITRLVEKSETTTSQKQIQNQNYVPKYRNHFQIQNQNRFISNHQTQTHQNQYRKYKVY